MANAGSTSTEKIFAIGDIHGCADELRQLLQKLPLSPDCRVVFMGDYIDRGENSREVIEIIKDLSNYYKVICLLGNHESMLLDFLEDPVSPDAGAFIYNGGTATLASYADRTGRYHIPQSHLDFYNSLLLTYETDQFFFVHAGVPNISLTELDPKKHKQDLIWIREEFLNSSFKWEKIIVHGHTPVVSVDESQQRINVDTGCVYDNNLSAIELPERNVYSVKKIKGKKHVYLRDESSERGAIRFIGKLPVDIFKNGKTYEFETIDYSEFGLYLTSKTMSGEEMFSLGEEIQGEIKTMADEPIMFSGRVVRVDPDLQLYKYAVQIYRPVTPE